MKEAYIKCISKTNPYPEYAEIVRKQASVVLHRPLTKHYVRMGTPKDGRHIDINLTLSTCELSMGHG
jgi:hypothetical protein